jgi:hypothetical protein
MARDHSHAAGHPPVSDRDPRICRNCDCAADARYNLEADMSLRKGLGFFTAASKDEGIAAFQADDSFALQRFLDQDGIDFHLRDGMMVRKLADVNQLSLRSKFKQQVISQTIMNHHVGVLKAFQAAQS